MKTKIVRFPAEETILREGETNANMYKIISGHAEVYVGYGTKYETLIGIIGPQRCFGEFGLLLHRPSIYTIIAFSDLMTLRITEDELVDFVRENQKNIIDIMRNMADTMMTMRYHIDLLIKEIESGRKPDAEKLLMARKAMKAYGMYRNIQEAVDHRGK
ncbi:MAG: cyclic nucleotide-binding domain-containing protein [Lachnospiraceae bacterium]|nr:cyclic nucleotide-binding domain-containing protein [Lachnospiraceae bacterium]